MLAHAPENERTFVESGAGVDRQLVMYNDFIIVGPANDPAQIKGQTDALAITLEINKHNWHTVKMRLSL